MSENEPYKSYLDRIAELEEEGMTTSDAQGVVEAEDMMSQTERAERISRLMNINAIPARRKIADQGTNLEGMESDITYMTSSEKSRHHKLRIAYQECDLRQEAKERILKRRKSVGMAIIEDRLETGAGNSPDLTENERPAWSVES